MLGFIKSLFGVGSSTHEKLTLQDQELGMFTALGNTANRIVWKGTADFLGEKISLFIHGEEKVLDASQKKAIRDFLNIEEHVAAEVDRTLNEQYDNADKKYTNRKTHFKCIGIISTETDITLSLEEKESFHHFNIKFINNNAVDITIDQ